VPGGLESHRGGACERPQNDVVAAVALMLAAIGRSRHRIQAVPSWRSRRSIASAISGYSILSVLSLLSVGSAGSILSVGSAGSILSIGSAGSILSIGAAGSYLSVGGSRRRKIAARRLAGGLSE
jgi:hypothetical protein